jgi:hypothetical protein
MNEKELIDDLLRYRLEMLAKEVPELKLAFDGNNLILNVCVAYSRKVAAENVTLKADNEELKANDERHETEIAKLRLESERKTEELGELRGICRTLKERLDKFAEWAKSR